MNDRGQVMVLVLGLSFVCFAVTGLAVDGTRAFLMRRSLQNAADGASLAAAGEVDVDVYYESSGRKVQIDIPNARRRALEWLSFRGMHGEASVSVERDRITVVTRGTVGTTFLRLIGISDISMSAEAAARPLPAPAGR